MDKANYLRNTLFLLLCRRVVRASLDVTHADQSIQAVGYERYIRNTLALQLDVGNAIQSDKTPEAVYL